MSGAGASGNVGDSEQAGADCDRISTKHSSKRSKAKHKGKVWDRVAWFSKKSKSKENPFYPVDSAEANQNHIDIELSPNASGSDSSSPFHSRIWVDSTSSSDSDIYEMHDGYFVKRSKLYPNSEIIEQNCLKPSIARALFLQMDASNHKYGGDKYRLPKKKKSRYAQISLEEDNDIVNTEPLSRTVSMPGAIKEKSHCHCVACCSCSPRERVKGVCPAYSHRRTSTSSLDTGLTNLEFDFDCSSSAAAMSDKELRHEIASQSDSQQEAISPVNDQHKSNSLPSYYSQSLQKKCKICGKLIRISRLLCDSNNQVVPNPPFMLSLTSDFCECKTHAKEPEAQCSRKSSNQSSVSPTSSVLKNDVDSLEFKKRLDLIKNWFGEFNDDQKNLVLKELMDQCQTPQIHMLSVEMKPRLHQGCPDNCQDSISWLPTSLALLIFSFLDPMSLCHAALVCRQWYDLATEPSLWRRFCCLPKWKLSRAGEQKQLLNHMMADGSVNWKKVFAEKYKLRNNWLKGKCNVRTFEGHTQGISCVQFDDTRIVSGSSDKTIKVWNIRTNSPWGVQTLTGHFGTVRCLNLDGNRLVSGSTDKTIKVWDLSTQQSWSSIACKVTMIGHLDTVRCLQVDDEKVISGSYDKTLKIWDVRKGVCKRSLRGHGAAVLCVQFDATKIVSGSCDKTIKIWTFEGECVMTLDAHHDAVTCLQFDDTRIVSGSLDCNLKFWDVNTGKCLKTVDWKASEGHTGVVRCLQADSWRVVSASDDRTLKVWNLETCQRLVTLRNHSDGVTCLQFNDSIIVSGSYDKTVKLWDFSCC